MAGLRDMDDVQVDESVFGRDVKFILVRISRDGESKVILKSTNAPFHSDMYRELARSLERGLDAEVTGGGFLYIDKSERTIRIWGSSNVFGNPDYQLAKKLLEKKYPDFEVYVK